MGLLLHHRPSDCPSRPTFLRRLSLLILSRPLRSFATLYPPPTLSGLGSTRRMLRYLLILRLHSPQAHPLRPLRLRRLPRNGLSTRARRRRRPFLRSHLDQRRSRAISLRHSTSLHHDVAASLLHCRHVEHPYPPMALTAPRRHLRQLLDSPSSLPPLHHLEPLLPPLNPRPRSSLLPSSSLQRTSGSRRDCNRRSLEVVATPVSTRTPILMRLPLPPLRMVSKVACRGPTRPFRRDREPSRLLRQRPVTLVTCMSEPRRGRRAALVAPWDLLHHLLARLLLQPVVRQTGRPHLQQPTRTTCRSPLHLYLPLRRSLSSILPPMVHQERLLVVPAPRPSHQEVKSRLPTV